MLWAKAADAIITDMAICHGIGWKASVVTIGTMPFAQLSCSSMQKLNPNVKTGVPECEQGRAVETCALLWEGRALV